MSGLTQSTVTYGSGVSSITNGTTSLINNVKIVGDGTTATTTYNATNNQVTISAIGGSSGVSSINGDTGAIILTSTDNSVQIANYSNQHQLDLSVPIGAGGVVSVVAGNNISVNNTDPQNPIVTAIIPPNTAVQSIVAGNNISVNNTDPQNPIISSTAVSSIISGNNILVNNSNPQNPIISSTAVSSVSAGSNITIDNTDPKNPIISASGGVTLVNGILGTVNIVAGNNITVASDIAAQTITISASGGGSSGVTSLNTATGTVTLQSTDQSIDINQNNNIIELSYINYDNYLPSFTSNSIVTNGNENEVYRYTYSSDPNNLINYLMSYGSISNPPNYVMKFDPMNLRINNSIGGGIYTSGVYLYLCPHYAPSLKILCGNGILNNLMEGIIIVTTPFLLPLTYYNSYSVYYGINTSIIWEFAMIQQSNPTGTNTLTLSGLKMTPLINWNIDAGVVI